MNQKEIHKAWSFRASQHFQTTDEIFSTVLWIYVHFWTLGNLLIAALIVQKCFAEFAAEFIIGACFSLAAQNKIRRLVLGIQRNNN